MEDMKYEEAIQKLEKIADELENGNLSLEESVEKFEEGMKISKKCTDILQKAEGKITMLVKDGENYKEEKFEI